MQRAIINSKSLNNKEAQRITDMQRKAFENYDPYKGYRNWQQEHRTAQTTLIQPIDKEIHMNEPDKPTHIHIKIVLVPTNLVLALIITAVIIYFLRG